MSLDNTKLLDFLGEVDKELSHKIVVVVGGTAMTLVKVKPSTIDIDFTIPGEFYDEFVKVKKIVNPGFRVDLFHDGAVFTTMLPEDYLTLPTLGVLRFSQIYHSNFVILNN
ncbi:MAG: hypothetical protein COW26_07785 [Nitrosopumilales archaeon CG15_BIG_FIL_POST_REV_8_21_14_020_33_23]|nr:MAG: hypothetical protein COW26_07785 [Nitrosopumilales archaeon CG15_BIG_FIL_POST_REV_8_21_14_020_33_23]